MAQQFFLNGTTQFTDPGTWNNASNTIDCIGSGGAGSGRISSSIGGVGGGGGAFARVINQTLTFPVTLAIPAAGAQSTCTFGGTICVADFGRTATTSTAGAAGATANSTGSTKNAGGAGFKPTSGSSGGGGGGAGGPSGAGSTPTNNIGGAADNGNTAAPAANAGGTAGTQYDGTHGSGSGGSGRSSSSGNGSAGGNYGGGGGGSFTGVSNTGGAGAAGLIAVSWVANVQTSATLAATSAINGNGTFPTVPGWSPTDKTANITLSNTNRTATYTTTAAGGIRSSTSHGASSGKWYAEFVTTTLSVNSGVGFAVAGWTETDISGLGGNSGDSNTVGLSPSGGVFVTGGSVGSSVAYANGNTLQVAVDMTVSPIQVYTAVNGGTYTPLTSGAGVSCTGLATGPWFLAWSDGGVGANGMVVTLNTEAAHQSFAAPAGFSSWDAASSVSQQGSATLAATSGLTADGFHALWANATLPGSSGTLSPPAILRAGPVATLSGVAGLTATPVALDAASAILRGTSTLVADSPITGTAALNGTSNLAATAKILAASTATLPADSNLTLAPVMRDIDTAPFPATSNLSANGLHAQPATATFPGTSSLSAIGTVPGQVHTYETSFPLTEDPISEAGVWHHTASSWKTISTIASHHAIGKVSTGGTDDSYAFLSDFAADHWVSVTIWFDATWVGGSDFGEFEILLRASDDATNARAYEVDLAADGSYLQIATWNGTFGSFSTLLDQRSFSAGIMPPVTGDILKAKVVGSVITAYLNKNDGKGDQQIATVTDSTYTTGQPGMGMFSVGTPTSRFGYSHFLASDGPAFPPIRDGAASITGTSALAANGLHAQPGTATLAGSSGFTASPIQLDAANATLPGGSGLTAAPVQQDAATATLPGASALTANGLHAQPGAATLPSVGSLTASIQTQLDAATAGLAGNSALTAAASVLASATTLFKSRASSATYWDAAGNLIEVPADTPRFGYDRNTGASLGLLVEAAATNLVINPRFVGLVSGSPGTIPTGFSPPPTIGLTRTLNSVVIGGETFYQIRLQGTTTGTGGVIIWIGINTGATMIPVTNGDVVTFAMDIARVAGAESHNLANLQIQMMTAAFGGLATFTGANISSSITGTPQRFSVTATINDATAAYIRVDFQCLRGSSIGDVDDVTYALGGPQVEKNGVATSLILPPVGQTGTSNRAADVIAPLTGTGSISADALHAQPAVALLPGSSSLASTGLHAQPATTTLAGDSSLTASPVQSDAVSATLAGTGALAAAASQQASVNAALAGNSSLSAVAALPAGTTALQASSSLTAAAIVLAAPVSLLAGDSTLTAAGLHTQPAIAHLAGDSNLTASGLHVQPGVETLAGDSGLSAPAIVRAAPTAHLSADSALSATAALPEGTVLLPGTSDLTATTNVTVAAAAAVAGDSQFTSVAFRLEVSNASFDAASTLSASAIRAAWASASLPGDSSLFAVAGTTGRADGAASLSGASTLTATVTRIIASATAELDGSSSLAGATRQVWAATATLAADSGLTVATKQAWTATAAFSGSSAVAVQTNQAYATTATFAADAFATGLPIQAVITQALLAAEAAVQAAPIVPFLNFVEIDAVSSLAAHGTVAPPALPWQRETGSDAASDRGADGSATERDATGLATARGAGGIASARGETGVAIPREPSADMRSPDNSQLIPLL